MTRERYLGLVAAMFVGGFVGGLISGAVMNYVPAGPAADPVPRASGAFNPRADEAYGDPPETICAKKIVIVDDEGNEVGVWATNHLDIRSPGFNAGTGTAVEIMVGDRVADVEIIADENATEPGEKRGVVHLQAIPDWPRLALTKGYTETAVLEHMGMLAELTLKRDDGKRLLWTPDVTGLLLRTGVMRAEDFTK